MCLAMNDDKLEPGERCASTSNRNFEGRQGAGGRTHLGEPRDGGGGGDCGALRRRATFLTSPNASRLTPRPALAKGRLPVTEARRRAIRLERLDFRKASGREQARLAHRLDHEARFARITVSNTSAEPVGRRLPRSQWRSVAEGNRTSRRIRAA
jgi:hypothetical protein